MTAVITSEDITLLPFFYKHPYKANPLFAKAGDTIWTRDDPFEVLHCHGASGKSSTYSGKGLFLPKAPKYTAETAALAGWKLVAEGFDKHLPEVPVGVGVVPALEETLLEEKFTPLHLVSFSSVWGKKTPIHPDTTADLEQKYNSLMTLYVASSDLSPSQKAQVHSLLADIKLLWNLTKLLQKKNASYTAIEKLILEASDHRFKSIWNVKYYLQDLKGRLEIFEFLEELNLDFNPFDATRAELESFAVAHGAKYIDGMTDKMLSNWVLAYLKVPKYSGDSVSQIQNVAKNSALLAEVAAKVPEVLAKKSKYSFLTKDNVSLSDVVSGDQVIYFANGNTCTVGEGAFVSGNPDGTVLRVYGADTWYQVDKDTKATVYEGYPKNFGSYKAHSVDLACGWLDLTPNWLNKSVAEVKPDFVSQQVWDFVLGSEFGGKAFATFIGDKFAKMDAGEINRSILGGENYFSVAAEDFDYWTKVRILACREAIRKLAAYAFSTYTKSASESETTRAVEILIAIKSLAFSGAYVHPDTTIWYSKELELDIPLAPGTKVYTLKDYEPYTKRPVLLFEGGSGVLIQKRAGKLYTSILGTSAVSSLSQRPVIYQAPENVALDFAHSEGWEFSEESFQTVEKAEKVADWTNEVAEAGAAWTFKVAIEAAAPTLGAERAKDYLGMVNKLYSFPVGVKQLVMESALSGDYDVLDVILWKLSKKAYAANLLEDKIDPTKPYAAKIKKGIIQTHDIEAQWGGEALDTFLADFAVVLSPSAVWSEKAAAAAGKLLELKKASAVSASADASQDTANLDLTRIERSYGGMHSKRGYADQFGVEWMAKYYASDANAQYRCDAEHFGNVLGRTFGFNNPQTFVRTIEGMYNILQIIVPNSGTFQNVKPKQLNLAQLISVMQEQVLDWWISNHDSWGANLLLAPDGKSAIGIDKGQAFKHHHDDKLEMGYLPRENPIPVWYDSFFQAVIDGSISPEIANKVAHKVLLKAYQVQTRLDERAQSLVESALSKRTTWPSGYDREKFTELVMDRKANLLKDFSNLYKDVFGKAGIAWTIDIEAFGKNVGHAYISNSPLFADEVRNASAFGKALFFNSLDIEDAHLMWTGMSQIEGGTALLGFGKIRKDADARLTSWLKTKLDETNTKKPVKKVEPLKPVTEALKLYDLDVFYERVVSLIKTVSTHASDGKYSEDTVALALNFYNIIRSNHTKTLENKKVYPDEPGKLSVFQPFKSLEHRDVWLEEAGRLCEAYLLALKAKSEGKTFKEYAPDYGTLKKPSYTPTPVVAVEEAPTVVEENEAEKDVQIAGKPFKVARRKAAQHGGKLDFETGKLLQERASKTFFQTGMEYSVTYGNVSIFYRPWTEEMVRLAQQGHLSIEVKNWDGGDEVIDDVLDTLNLMGIDTTPADAQSLELFYWRHLTGVISDRVSTTALTKLRKAIRAELDKNPKLSVDEELEIHKKAWSEAYSSELVNKADWRPRFNLHFGNIEGRPAWIRFDFSLADLKKIYGASLVIHNITNKSDTTEDSRIRSGVQILQTGRILPTEERPRILGLRISGSSSDEDQNCGSSAFVFCRQNLERKATDTEPYVVVSPIASLRTHTYAFDTDYYGKLHHRKTSADFVPESMYSHKGSHNEIMIKNEAPVVALIVGSEKKKKEAITKLKAAGVTKVNGRNVEDTVYTSSEWNANRVSITNEIWEWAIEQEKELEAEW